MQQESSCEEQSPRILKKENLSTVYSNIVRHLTRVSDIDWKLQIENEEREIVKDGETESSKIWYTISEFQEIKWKKIFNVVVNIRG